MVESIWWQAKLSARRSQSRYKHIRKCAEGLLCCVEIMITIISGIVWFPYLPCLLYWHQAPIQWRHNGRNGVSNHQPHHCLPNCLFRRRSKKTSKLRVTGVTGDRWIPRTKGQWHGKCFHLMTSSCLRRVIAPISPCVALWRVPSNL